MSTTQPVRALAALLVFGAAALTACSAAPPPAPGVPEATAAPAATGPASASAGPSCTDRAKKGVDDVLAVVAANRACTTDADCATISVGASCFDVCSRSVNKQGVAAVEKAEADVNATTCATYKQDGCRFDVPPCAPPSAPKCRQNQCV